MACCRGLLTLVLAGMLFISMNVMFLWNHVTPQPQCICNCGGRLAMEGSPGRHSVVIATDPPKANLTSNAGASDSIPQSKLQQTGIKAARTYPTSDDSPLLPIKNEEEGYGPHQLAVLVPFRNRYEEMMEFAPHIHQFLTRQKVKHQIWIINQADNHRFNRAALLNIGFLLSRDQCDYMVMHDIDLLPVNDDLQYSYPAASPFHISSPELHPLYHYKTFVGGVLMMTRNQFEKVNGLSNLFWGWGREDDELYLRMREAGMKVHYPQGITTGYQTFKHIHDKDKRPRDQKRYYNQWEVSRHRDRNTGLNTVKYEVVNSVEMTIVGAPLNFVNVEVECDYTATPFCDTPS